MRNRYGTMEGAQFRMTTTGKEEKGPSYSPVD